jgi:NAD+ synthase
LKKWKNTYDKNIQDFLTMANTRARLRMTTLYAYAGHHKLLVAGTGNKVEDFGIGFYTKYGDGGVDVSPDSGFNEIGSVCFSCKSWCG